MSLSNSDITHLLLALGLLLIAAHGMGQLFARFRQPRVAGEILGGLLLGPTLFGLLLPEAHKAVFAGEFTRTGLGIVYQLGLLLLMYCSGAQLRSIITRSERKSTVSIAMFGNVVPFLAGLLFLRLYDTGRFLGPARDRTSFALVFALALAVTSIPVISRIMADLGILGTRFARIVLSVAVLEDVLVYVVLNIALALVAPHSARLFGLPGILGIEPSSAVGSAYYVVLTLGFFALPALLGPGLVQKLSDMPRNVLNRSNPIAFQLVMLLAMSAIASFLGVSPIFGALVAGILAGDLHGESARAKQSIQSFSYAFFIPVYFAVVGLRLDLVHHFDPLFFVFFLLFACSAKSISCYLGARMTGETHPGAKNLAVALNARGGPGIVLASVAFDARIIDARFYTILVMLALTTSVIAGSWLSAVLERGEPLLTGDEQRSPAEESSPIIDASDGAEDRPALPREPR